MSDVVNVLVAVAVIVVVFRWATSSTATPAEQTTARALGFKPKKVTDDMVNTVTSMFPDLPRDNIRYDLLRTGNVEQTTNKILERGYLDAPPQSYYTVYPRTPVAAVGTAGASAGSSTATPAKAAPSLINRFRLEDRVTPEAAPVSEDAAGGKAKWEDSAAKREASLKERKAQMVLAARQRLLAQKQTAAGTS